MTDRPQVYKTDKIKRLEHFRERYEKIGTKEHIRLAMEYERAMHDMMIEILQELQALRADVKALQQQRNGER